MLETKALKEDWDLMGKSDDGDEKEILEDDMEENEDEMKEEDEEGEELE